MNILEWKHSEEKNISECVEKLRPRCWPEETTICYKISLVQWLITNLNVILYLSTCHAVYISVLIIFMIMPSLIINTYVSLMYELKKIGKVFTSKFVGTGPSSCEKRIYRAAVSQRLRNTELNLSCFVARHLFSFLENVGFGGHYIWEKKALFHLHLDLSQTAAFFSKDFSQVF